MLVYCVQYVSNFRALLWVTVMLMFLWPFFCLVSELNLTDKCLDGALNNNAYESDVLQVKGTLWTPSSCCRSWCTMAPRRARSHIFCVFLFFHQNYLSSRGKSWKDLRQEALQNVEQGKYYPAGKPARPHIWMIHTEHKRKNWVSAVLPLNKSDKSVSVRLSHLWKYHHMLGLRPASFEGPCLQIQTEHPFIRTARSNRIDVFSCSYSSPDINGAVCSFFFHLRSVKFELV